MLTPSAALAVFDAERRILLARHVHDGRWGTPGGAVEPGESPQVAAQRELEEETGLRAGHCELIGAYGGEEFVVTYSNGDLTAYVVILYGTRGASGTVVLQTEEVHEVGWFGQEQARGLDLWPTMKAIIPDAFSWLRAQECSF